MGFLKRSRRKRTAFSSGRPCYRGYEFSYTISKQGLSYLKWLESKKPLEDVGEAALALKVLSSLPEDVQRELTANAILKAGRRYRGPARKPVLPMPTDNCAALLVNQQIEVEKLKRERDLLVQGLLRMAQENFSLRSEVDGLKRTRDDFKRALTFAMNVTEALVVASRFDRKMCLLYRDMFELTFFTLSAIARKEGLPAFVELLNQCALPMLKSARQDLERLEELRRDNALTSAL